MAARIKKGDRVIVIAGDDFGVEGEVERVDPQRGKAVVAGVNVAVRHTRQSPNAQGGRIAKNLPVDLSNLAIVDPEQGGPTRVGFRVEDGRKIRYAKKSGAKDRCLTAHRE